MYREEEEGVVGALVGAGSVGTMGWSQAHQSLTFAFQGHRLVSGLGSSRGISKDILRRARVQCRSHKAYGWSARPCGRSQPSDTSLWLPGPRVSSTQKNPADKPSRWAKGHSRQTDEETK